MSNRLNDVSNEDRANVQKVMARVYELAYELCDLIKPGMVVNLSIPEKQDIVVPNQQPKAKKIIIIRPSLMLQIDGK